MHPLAAFMPIVVLCLVDGSANADGPKSTKLLTREAYIAQKAVAKCGVLPASRSEFYSIVLTVGANGTVSSARVYGASEHAQCIKQEFLGVALAAPSQSGFTTSFRYTDM
jgi:hypothetical protein